jgi:hypothetical protein
VEAGAGTGSAAESILYFFSNYHRELLPQLEYTIVEISPSLCRKMEQKLGAAFPHLMRNKQLRIINQDISDYKQEELCFMLFFEVLDNLPHDKLIWNNNTSAYDSYATADLETAKEMFEPIAKDALIGDCLDLYLSSRPPAPTPSGNPLDRIANYLVDRMMKKGAVSKDLFLPTYMLRLMRRIRKNIPQAHLLISDFDQLVTNIPGINAPIVSRKGVKSEEKVDFETYLVARGDADIFFPVDFPFLQAMHQSVLGRSAQVVKTYEFMGEFSEEAWAQTKSSFNPIREDFANTSFLVTNLS